MLESDSPGVALAEWLAALMAFGKAKRSLTAAMLDSQLLLSCKQILHGATDALLARAQQAGAVRAGVQGADVMRLTHAVSLAADMGQDPGQAERMLALVLGGVLNPAD